MIEGTWYLDIFGLYGWESIGVLVLNDGHAVGGGNHHYSIGGYQESNDQISITLTMNYKDVPRTLFGESRKKFKVVFDGTYSAKKTRIQGSLHRPGRDEMVVVCRLTKGGNLPWAKKGGSIQANVKNPKVKSPKSKVKQPKVQS